MNKVEIVAGSSGLVELWRSDVVVITSDFKRDVQELHENVILRIYL